MNAKNFPTLYLVAVGADKNSGEYYDYMDELDDCKGAFAVAKPTHICKDSEDLEDCGVSYKATFRGVKGIHERTCFGKWSIDGFFGYTLNGKLIKSNEYEGIRFKAFADKDEAFAYICKHFKLEKVNLIYKY